MGEGWGGSPWALEFRVTAGIEVERRFRQSVPGSSVNGGVDDQEVGNDFNCKEGEGDIARCV